MQNKNRVLTIILAVVAMKFIAGCLFVAISVGAFSVFSTTRVENITTVDGNILYEQQVETIAPSYAEYPTISLQDVRVEIGVGSPIPVEVVDEVLYMEGRGPFAFYDFDLGQYVAWDKPLGNYAWSPDGESLAFDNLTYTATGNEHIYIREREGGAEIPFSANLDPGYAAFPAFSPQGDQIAYLVEPSGPESQRYTLVVQGYPTGEARQLGVFENVYALNWSPDSNRLAFSFGEWGEQEIAMVNLLDGSSTILVAGMQPSLSIVP